MKKHEKKLELAKETLRMLEKSEIREVVGGSGGLVCAGTVAASDKSC